MYEYMVNTIGYESIGALTPLFVGMEQCESGHRFGPYVRDYYIIHFCLAGEGVLQDKNGNHKVSAGELFIIRPGEITTYMADKKNPWEYCWIAFQGAHAKIFEKANSVYRFPRELCGRFFFYVSQNESAPECYIAFLYELIYLLFRKRDITNDSDDRLAKIRQYIDYHYMHNLRVAVLSQTFGFERSYLYRMFKRRFGIGVKEYITAVRMEHAREFLKAGHTVGDTAHMVGYDDVFHFSKSFKVYFGTSPSEDRSL